MAGHSQFKNIMHRKGRQDAARARLFAKFGREITTAARNGSPDPDMNPRLRLAIQAARAENMPKDNIERAIKKAAGADTESLGAGGEQIKLLFGFDVELKDAGFEGGVDLPGLLADTREDDALEGGFMGAAHALELTAGDDVESCALFAE